MVHVRIDEKVKAEATKALEAMGLSVSDAVRLLLTRIATEKVLPFDVRVPNARTQAAMRELRGSKRKRKRHASVASLMAELNEGD